MYEQCAILSERFDKIERDQKFNELIAAWKPAEKKAFNTFMEEANKFYEIQAKNGVNLEGTFEIQEEIFFKNNLLSSLQALERGELPNYTAEEFQRAEAAENAAYQRTQTGSDTHWGTVTRQSVQKSEDALAKLLQRVDFLRAGKNIQAFPNRVGKPGWILIAR